MLVFGTRPEAIKMAPLVRALAAHDKLSPIVCLTAQHREMVDQVLELFHIQPEIDLDLMQPGQSLSQLTGRLVTSLEPVMREHRPDAVLVQGDTTSTFCGALSAFYHQIPIGHVEAGLRTGDLSAPFPEEANRVLTTRLANWHFAATEQNRDLLLAERIPADRILVTGNTVIDALFLVRRQIEAGSASPETTALLEKFSRPFILITGHRRESFGPGFERICGAIATLARRFPDRDWVYPVHLNPHVKEPVSRHLGTMENIHLIDPQPYEPFVGLMSEAQAILTDSGGVQEEAPALGKPTLVMREKTERTEGLGGGVCLVGTDTDRIVNEMSRLLTEPEYYQQMATAVSPYGDGTAAEKIVAHLAEQLLSDDHSVG